MEESKEQRNMEDEKEEVVVLPYDADNNYDTIFNNMFQKPYDFIEEIVRAILRCLGFDLPSSSPPPSEPTTTTTTVGAGVGAGAGVTDDGAEGDEEATCPDKGLPPPSPSPEQGGDDGCDVGSGEGVDAGEEADEDDETACPEKELPPPSPSPELGGDDGCDVGGGEDGGGDSTDPAVETEPVDGSRPPGATPTAEAMRRKPPRPGVSSGRDPQIH